jgi:pyruvate formate lyase activating enzyme
MVIRMPLLPGINNSEKNLVEVARFISGFDTKLHIDLLPYHRFGQGKYKMLDRDYPLNVKPPSEEELQRAVEILKQYGLDCSIQK